METVERWDNQTLDGVWAELIGDAAGVVEE